jgi:hypothetical protein
MRFSIVFLTIALLLLATFGLAVCDDDDDDAAEDDTNDDADGPDDDDSGCIQCDSTAECQLGLGDNWMCVGDCCEEIGGDDDDDDDTFDGFDDDNDTTDDDDDTGSGLTCEDVYSYMYIDCGWAFTDIDGNEIALEDLIAWCEADEAGYGVDDPLTQCIAVSECDDIPDCV